MQGREQYMHSNGTTALETFSIILPSFFFAFIVCLLHSQFGKVSKGTRAVLEYIFIILPIILNVTILAQYVNSLLISLLVITLSICVIFISKKDDEAKEEPTSEKPGSKNIDCITLVRSTINLISVIGILAVDFTIFPRRFTKTITYGYSLMDVGVGLYVFSNGVVAPELRQHKNSLRKTIRSVIPLIVIGGARFLLTKEIDYNVPVSEYGVHWNFFITLAFTKIFTSLIFSFIAVENSIFTGISLLLVHEVILQLGLAKYVCSTAERNNFFTANREGIVSILGYVGIYYLSVAYGKFVTVKYNEPSKSKWKFFLKLCAISGFLLWATLILEKNFGISRRLANSGYCIWIMFIGVFMTSLFYLGTLIQDYIYDRGAVKTPLIFEAINYNGLAFFLLANILTGLINITFDTLTVRSISSLIILTLYMLLNCSVMYILFAKQIKIKL